EEIEPVVVAVGIGHVLDDADHLPAAEDVELKLVVLDDLHSGGPRRQRADERRRDREPRHAFHKTSPAASLSCARMSSNGTANTFPSTCWPFCCLPIRL